MLKEWGTLGKEFRVCVHVLDVALLGLVRVRRALEGRLGSD